MPWGIPLARNLRVVRKVRAQGTRLRSSIASIKQRTTLVNSYILYPWARAGWCVGLITALHPRKLGCQLTSITYANFVFYYG